MKKFWKSLMFAALGVFALSSCEDVPAPYDIPGADTNPGKTIEAVEATCAEAVELTNALDDGATSAETYTITGYITEVVGDVSRNQQTFWMADAKDGGRVFEAYWANLPEGISQFKVGSKVKITGKLTKYVNNNTGKMTAEMKNANVEILEDGDDTPGQTGIEATCAEAVELTNALADGATSAETYTVTGYITEVVGDVSRNQQTFWMADAKDGGRVFEAYWANLPEGVSAFKAGSKVKITGKLTKYVNNNTGKVTAEMKNPNVEILEDGDDTPPVEGTAVTCAEAVTLTNALADGATSAETYTVTGYITEVVGSVSKNQQTFWMADAKDGGRVFEAYWANLPSGVSEFKAGMKVKITGQLMKYVKDGKVTPEIKNANVEILEDGDDTPPVVGTDITCAEAVTLTNALADGATSAETYTVTGYITEVVGNVSRNQQTFWMADTKDGGKVFEAYYANLPEGVSAFKAGMKVKITGQLLKYVNSNSGQVTPEIKNANVEILEDGDDTPGDNPGGSGVEGNSITFSTMGYENSQSLDGQPITLGYATLTFSKASGGTAPAYYNTGSAMRMYGSNTLTIASSKTISKVEFKFADGKDSNDRPYYPTTDNASVTPGNYDFATQTWTGSANEIVLTYTAKGGHFRIIGLTITYAE